MNEGLKLAIAGFGMGILGVGVWYVEMFLDSRTANLWRWMNGKGRIGRNFAAIGAPSFACIFLLVGISGFIKYFKLSAIWLTCVAAAVLIFFAFFLIGLLPIKFPRWVYADWQYAKRHGLLDEKGNVDQEAWARHKAERKGEWWGEM